MKCSIDGCDNPCEGTLWICATHNHERRKAERESKKIKVIRPVKKVSEKRGKELESYPKLKKQFLEFKMACEMKFEGCTVTATQPHHCSIGAKNFLNTDTWLAVCFNCHTRLEAIPAEERRAKGLLTD